MNSSITDLENEIYGMRVDNIIGTFEYDVQVKVNASIELMLERVDALVAAGFHHRPRTGHSTGERRPKDRTGPGHGEHAGTAA